MSSVPIETMPSRVTVELLCDHCGKPFLRNKRVATKLLKRGKVHHFCSPKCAYASPLRTALVSLKAIERVPIPNIQMSDLDIGYVAGCIDGEGSIGISQPKGKRFNVLVEVGNTDPRMIERLVYVTAVGWISIEDRKNRKNRTMHIWHVTAVRHIATLLPIILPVMTVKKDQARLLLTFCERRLAGIPIEPIDFTLREQLINFRRPRV